MANSLAFRRSHRLILFFALAGTASLGSASLGSASLGPVSLGPVSLGPVSLGPVSLGPAQAQSSDPATTINGGLQAYCSFDEAGHDDSPWGRNIAISPPLRLEQSGGTTTLKLSEPNAFLRLDQINFPRHP